MAMSIQVQAGSSVPMGSQIVVDYGYEERFGGNRRYGQYIINQTDSNLNITANTIAVDDRDVTLFNTLIASGTLSVIDASFDMVNLVAAGSGTVTAGTATVINAPTGVTAYDVKIAGTGDFSVTKYTAGDTFQVNISSGTSVVFQYAVLTYNTNFEYKDQKYGEYLVGKQYQTNGATT